MGWWYRRAYSVGPAYPSHSACENQKVPGCWKLIPYASPKTGPNMKPHVSHTPMFVTFWSVEIYWDGTPKAGCFGWTTAAGDMFAGYNTCNTSTSFWGWRSRIPLWRSVGFGGWPYDSPLGDLFPLSGHSDHHPSPFTLHTGFEMILIPPKIFQSLTGGWFQSFLFTWHLQPVKIMELAVAI